MKKLFISILLSLIAIFTWAERPVILGVDISKSTPEDFKQNLLRRDWRTFRGREFVLIGKFSGISNCLMAIEPISGTDSIACVRILKPYADSWSSLLQDYDNLAAKYTKKYGVAYMISDKFRDSDDSESNGESVADKAKRCRIYSLWNFDTYRFAIHITPYGGIEYFYQVKYNKEMPIPEM